MNARVLMSAALAAALSMSAGAQIVALTIDASHISGAGEFLTPSNAVKDAYVNGTAFADGSTFHMQGQGAYTYKLPDHSESGQVYSYLTSTMTIGDDPVMIDSYHFGGPVRTVVSGGPTTPISTISTYNGVVDVFNEGAGFFAGPVYHNNGPIMASLSNNSSADWVQDAQAPTLVGAILAPHTQYTVTEAMVASYSFTRATGDTFTYAITQEFGGFGPAGNNNFIDMKYTTLPEPASMAALAIGGLGMLARRRRRRA